MRIISHRGYWLLPEEKNTCQAFQRSFEMGFGTETDIRDCSGVLVISHDPPSGCEMPLRDFLALHADCDNTLPLALNVKADGLQQAASELLAEFAVPEFFFFDMAIPDALGYLELNLPIYTRHSDIETELVLYESASGIWLDSFGPDWVEETVIKKHLNAGKHVCLVSPELHRRDHLEFWKHLAKWPITSHQNFILCTDYPVDAKELLS